MHNEDLVAILNALPPDHRRALIRAHKPRLKGAKNNRERLARIAGMLGVDGIAPYRSLYLEGNGRLFTWYLAPDVQLTAATILDRYRTRYQNAAIGEHPEVQPGEDPRFNRILRAEGPLRVEYAFYGSKMELPNRWGTIEAVRYRQPEIVIRDAPLTFEFRRVPTATRTAMIRSLSNDLQLPERALVPCLLNTDELRENLRVRLDAIPRGIKKKGRGFGLGTIQIWTDGSVSLLEQIDYQGNLATHHEVFQLAWDFLTPHRHPENYAEKSTYLVTVETGDMRISEGASELAIDRLRQNVVALF